MIFRQPLYAIHVVSIAGGKLKNNLGMTVETERAEDLALDTLLVGGAPDNSNPPAESDRISPPGAPAP